MGCDCHLLAIFFLKIDGNGNYQERSHYFVGSSILGLLLSHVCWLIRIVWECCVEEVRWRMSIRKVDEDLSGQALSKTLEKKLIAFC
jgi:hypothetical protein